MGASFLITLREGIEAALIIGIMLGYLSKVNESKRAKYVWAGTGAAVLASVLTAYLFETVAGGFSGRAEEIFEGITMLVAVCILTVMIALAGGRKRNISRVIRDKTAAGTRTSHGIGLFSLAFFSVYREGVETVLFLKAAALSGGTGGNLFGGFLGLGLAVFLAFLVFKSTIRLDLARFFRYTGLLLVLVAAGLFAQGLHELQEAGLLPAIVERVWDINGLLPERGTLGSFLKALFGYNGNPSLLEVIAWAAYLAIFAPGFFRREKQG
ncbi:MAG: FTR1 family iron permease [Bacteroidota bacterium]